MAASPSWLRRLASRTTGHPGPSTRPDTRRTRSAIQCRDCHRCRTRSHTADTPRRRLDPVGPRRVERDPCPLAVAIPRMASPQDRRERRRDSRTTPGTSLQISVCPLKDSQREVRRPAQGLAAQDRGRQAADDRRSCAGRHRSKRRGIRPKPLFESGYESRVVWDDSSVSAVSIRLQRVEGIVIKR